MAQPDSRDFGAEMAGLSPREIEPTTRHSSVKMIRFRDAFKDDSTKDEPPERFLMDTMAMRPRSLSHHLSSTKVPSRKWLIHKARFWRFLMGLGMPFHSLAPPRPTKHSFVRKISTDTIPIELYFYVPNDYKRRIKSDPEHRYPIVVNFHGGGFCLGHATDDIYWANVIIKSIPAVVVSVNYRRAPEHPFPQPVDDCVEALLYLQARAEELHLDPSQIALSGFSAGANLAFAVPFRLTFQYERQESTDHLLLPQRKSMSNFAPPQDQGSPKRTKLPPEDQEEQEMGALTPLPDQAGTPNTNGHPPWSLTPDDLSSTTNVSQAPNGSRTNLLDLPGPRSQLLRTMTQDSHRFKRNILNHKPHQHQRQDSYSSSSSSSGSSRSHPKRIRIVSILAWYPLLDWTSSRSEKKRTSRNPKKTLPAVFTDLFDFSYLPAPDHAGHHCSPYASPALAPDHMIRDGLPERIQMWLCEWDMLLAEGEGFARKLASKGKDVKSETVAGVPHGWDKSPNPFRDQKMINALYERAAGYLRDVFSEAERGEIVGEGVGLGGLR